MQRLPFNPERLLAFFMTEENARSLAGDLEERFQWICQHEGWLSATAWFCRSFLWSLPPVVIEAMRPGPKTVMPDIPSTEIVIMAVPPQSIWLPYVHHECKKDDGCVGSIRWEFSIEDGSQHGFCQECGTLHVTCGNCGEVHFQDGNELLHCGGCGAFWKWNLEGMQRLSIEVG
jgi:hypothetical protein